MFEKQLDLPFASDETPPRREGPPEYSQQSLDSMDEVSGRTTWHLHRTFSPPIDKELARSRRKARQRQREEWEAKQIESEEYRAHAAPHFQLNQTVHLHRMFQWQKPQNRLNRAISPYAKYY